MWIERLELTGFGNVVGEKIDFENDKLNLVVEANEFGKSTIATAVWAALFDFPAGDASAANKSADKSSEREAFRPRLGTNAPYGVTLWVTAGDRSLKLVRDFNLRTLKVLDRGRADADVTAEFQGSSGEEHIGVKLTGMTRDLFRSTCFVGQRELDEHSIGEDLASVVQGIADSSTASHTAAGAISAIESGLFKFEYKGSRIKIDQLIRDLESQRKELYAKLDALNADREVIATSLNRLDELDRVLEAANGLPQDESTSELMRQAKEIDNRIVRLRQSLYRIQELNADIEQVGSADDRVAEWEIAVRDLFQKRDVRISEYNMLKSEAQPEPGAADSEELERSFQRKWRGLAEFTPQDAQSLSLLLMRITDIKNELDALTERRDAEATRLAQGSVNIEKVEAAKQKLSQLDLKDTTDALGYDALMTAAREQIVDCERSVVQYRAQLTEIEHQRLAQRKKDLLLGAGAGALFVIAVVIAVLMHDMLVVAIIGGLIAAAALGGSGFFFFRFFSPGQFRKREYDKVGKDLNDKTALAQQLHLKIGALEVKIESIARKAGLTNGLELVSLLSERSESAPQLRSIESMEVEIASKEGQFKRTMEELKMYFNKAGIPAKELSLERARKLSEDVAACVEDGKSVQAATSQTRLKLQQLALLNSEVESIEGKLNEIFQSVGIEASDSLDTAHQMFNLQLDAYYRVQKLKGEIIRLEQDALADTSFPDISGLVEHLESTRNQLREDMGQASASASGGAAAGRAGGVEGAGAAGSEGAGAAGSEGAGAAGSAGAGAAGSAGAGAASVSPQERARLSDERNDLVLKLRLSAKNHDDHYINTLESIDRVDRHLERIRQAKVSLELARDTLKRLSGQNYVDWSAKLNLIADEMLKELNLDYESLSFSPDLQLVARRRGDDYTISSPHFANRLSVGTREQLHWLARMVVSRYLSRENPLPIVLDEPFSESDDERFRQIMQFVIDVLSKQHQVIVFSCHRQRHHWLYEQLSDQQKSRVRFSKREQIDANTGALGQVSTRPA